MKIASLDKAFHVIIKEIAHNQGIGFQAIADNRVIELTYENKLRRIVGYNFDINDVGAWMAAKYKDITSGILDTQNIPHVEHKVFKNPKIFSDVESNWFGMIEFAKKYDYNVVCKPNSGSFGVGVTRVTNQARLEEVTTNLFMRCSAITLSPYYNIISEIRHIILDDECVLIYRKERPSLRGNGRDTVSELLIELVPSFDTFYDFAEFLEYQELDESDSIPLNHVLAEEEIYHLGWKHNSAKASSYTILSASPYQDLALRAGKALNLSFSSVDIIETCEGPRIIEANAGVPFRKLYKTNFNEIKEVYSKAIKKMFQIE